MIEQIEKKSKIKLPQDFWEKVEGFLGRIKIENLIEDVTAYKKELYGLSEDSLIELVETKNERVPYKLGRIVQLAEDSFKGRYTKYYGEDRTYYPKVGDIVLFVPNQNFRMDPSGKYSIISDEDIIAFYKGNQ